MFEDAKWIGSREHENPDGSCLLRRAFFLPGRPEKGILSVCGLGYGVYTVNGREVTDEELTTPFTRFDRTALYNSWEITGLLRQGENAAGVFLGNGWYNDIGEVWEYDKATWRSRPKMILRMEILLEGGERVAVVSDSSWKSRPGPSVYNHVREGEIYDARLELPGWDRPGFDDAQWERAAICPGAGGILRRVGLPPVRVIKTLRAKPLGGGIYDFGENTSGWAQIAAAGECGREITVRYAEKLNRSGDDIDNGKIGRYMHGSLRNCDRYIMRGSGREVWHPRFVFHGFRYVKVENAPPVFEICAKVLHADLPVIGEFECSDALLNRIHQAVRRSTLSNMHSIPTDCPHREQNGWTEDALASAQQSLMNYDMKSFYAKWLDDFRDVQRPSGQLPGIVPTSSWGYEWGGGPSGDSALIQIPYEVFRITGDDFLIRRMWDCMCRYLRFMESMAENWIVDYGLGDWNPPKGANVCPSAVTDTALFYADACVMARCAERLGYGASSYRELAEHVRRAFRKCFLHDGVVQGDSQTGMACAIYLRLYDPCELPAAAAHLNRLVEENGCHIDCGLLGTKFIFGALSENGYAETAYRMVTNPTMPSYAWWICNGMTTLCEDWDMSDSLNHHMFSEVDMWFYKYLAGIRIEEGRVTIRPCFLPKLQWVRARHGDIAVEWNRSELTVDLPARADVVVNGRAYPVGRGRHRFHLDETGGEALDR